MASPAKRSKVGSACQRCRRQKLKCDIQRPCTLCVRAGVDCKTVDQWRVVQTPRDAGIRRKRTTEAKRQHENSYEGSNGDAGLTEQPLSSSTMSLVEGAFQFHNSTTPDMSLTSALPGSRRPRQSQVSGASDAYQTEKRSGRPHASNAWTKGLQSMMMELISLLPSRAVAALLVDTYFDRVHWFMLIFHQNDFRQSWQQMYDSPTEQLVEVYPNPGFITIFLMVIAIALQYTGEYRRRLLQTHNVDSVDLKKKILSTIQAKILDIASLGSLESVQTCILLGTYYLYHGNPELAWPVCGCGLRIAQALNLHRKLPRTGSRSPEMHRQYETQKRCWWAVYEIETFCSMSYGYPHSIKDLDCDVELLDPLVRSTTDHSPASFDTTHQCPSSLLSYKYLMSKLSVLIKDILTDLYGLGSIKESTEQGSSGNSFRLQNLVNKVSGLDARLRKWKAEIPDSLQLNSTSASLATYMSVDEMDRDIGASGPVFEKHIYQFQALALELAYKNAMILVHRPLLTYKTIPRANPEIDSAGSAIRNPFHQSLQSCRDAALSTSNIETNSIFLLAADTYAAAFIGIHTFTAGVMLCILTSIEPLTPQSYQSKMGLRRLLSMQAHLKSRSHSIIAAQGLEILERLARLVMEEELKQMLTTSKDRGLPLTEATSARGEESTHEPNEIPPNDQMTSLVEVPTDEGAAFDCIEDPAMLQTLCDFDQVLSGNDLNVPLDPLFPDLLACSNGVAQELAWIWGVDSLAQFPADD